MLSFDSVFFHASILLPASSGMNQACEPQMGKARVDLCGLEVVKWGCSFFLDAPPTLCNCSL